TIMAFDRYVSICQPLRYQSIMTSSNISKLIILAWLLPFVLLGMLIALTSRLPLCDNIIEKLYCDNCYQLSPMRTFLSLQLLIVPPLLNPLIYGIRLQEMRVAIVRVFQKQRAGSK
ncbi:olfactory receptor 11H1-like, partial [Megalops cyprinoides]|uniref:olfactory receptor 11H1-like n=1 Tax=Megalops cyprinoides TaxID=118141 RepID=UPI001864BB02